MLEDAAALSDLLLHWEDATDGHTPGSSGELLDFFGELHSTFDVPGSAKPHEENTDGGPPLSRSSLCRRRQREEIKRLRHEVEQLETQYERLLEGSAEKRSTTDVSDVVEMERPASGAWERIARHQQELRRAAECENVKLRSLVDEHNSLARRIEKAIHNRALEERTKNAVEKDRACEIAVLETKAAEEWKATAASPHWQRIFHIVFHNESFWMTELERELLNISADPNGRSIIEGVSSKVYPFDVAKTSEATWRSYNSHFVALAGGFFAVTNASDNLLAAEVQVTLDISGKAHLLSYDVLIHKIHEQADRVVFVWESWSPTSKEEDRTLTDASGDCATRKVRMVMDICCSIEQLARGFSNSEPATLVRVYSISRPSDNEAIPEDAIRVSRDKLVASYHDSNRRFSQLVETYLLDDALGLRTTLTASASSWRA